MKKVTVILTVICLLISVFPFSASAGDVFEEWKTEEWTIAEENGESVLKGNSSSSMNLLFTKKTVDTNCLMFDIYMEDSTGTADGCIGAAYKCTNGFQYFCEYNTVSKLVRIRRIGPGVDAEVGAAKSFNLDLKTWYNFKIIFENNRFEWSIDGEVIYSLNDTNGDPFTGGTCYIQGYFATPKLKNIRLFNIGENQFSDWQTGGWNITEENGETVLLGDSSSSMNLLFSNSGIDKNTLDFDVLIADSTGTADGCVGAAYKCTNGFQYFCEYNTVNKLVRIRRIGPGVDEEAGTARSFSLEINKWYNFQIVFKDNSIQWYIDDQLLYSLNDTKNDPLTGGTYYIQGYFATPKLKNIKLYNQSTDAKEVTDVDLEFIDSASVNDFTAQKGFISYDSEIGALKLTVSGEGAYLQSPKISAEKGNAYRANLTVKNTIFARIKNETSARQIKVYFITEADDAYTEEKSRVFDIVPNSDFLSYYFNLSGIPGAQGYITGFRFAPIGAPDGSITVDSVSFEREKELYEYAGKINSCVADNNNVTVTGILNSEYSGKKVLLYEIDVANYMESIDSLTPIAEVQANGTEFKIVVPFMGNTVTRLSSLFIAAVDGVKISDRFSISNYYDFSENPYAFELPALTVSVTDEPFGAKGDAFTNDTAAIQSAIDYISQKGGGVVIVPGSNDFYGKRYVVTNIKMKSNVELRIEEGAILWQSPRAWDYDYDVAYGHDISIPGINWTHAASCHNYPLIQGDNVSNVKVTGGGTLRCVDTGADNLDSVSGSTIWTGCENRIHVVPIGFWRCSNVEIRDITLVRTNNYHINMRTCTNIYIGNVTMKEVTCASGDGISATVGTKNIIIDRCYFYSNDDAVTICSTYNDPRGLAWWHANPGGDNCIENLKVIHSNLNGGHGITFITWGTDAPDISLQEIKNIEVFDCVLNGGTSAVGAWPDNPYYGKTPFDGTETNDFSPVKDVYIHDNDYRGACNIECLKATNFITDCGIASASDFLNGDFERKNGKPGWVSGISNWSYDLSEGAKVGTEKFAVAGKDNYKGFISGKGRLYEGLYMTAGKHVFTIDTELISGEAAVFAADANDNGMIAYKKLTKGTGEKVTIEFILAKGTTVYMGVETNDGGKLYIDNAAVTSEAPDYTKYFTENFETLTTPTFDFDLWKLVKDGDNTSITIPSGGSGLHRLGPDFDYSEFDLKFSIKLKKVCSNIDGNVGISFCRQDGNNQYYIEYNSVLHYISMRKFVNGAPVSFVSEDCSLELDKWYTFALRFAGGEYEFYIDGEKLLSGKDDNSLPGAKLLLCGYNTEFELDNITVAEHGTLDISEIIDFEKVNKRYRLTFDANGGVNSPAEQLLKEGERPGEVEAPVREGFKFVGWTVNGAVIDILSFKMPAEDTTLTAVWEKLGGSEQPPTDNPITGAGCLVGAACASGAMLLSLLIQSFRRRKKLDKIA